MRGFGVPRCLKLCVVVLPWLEPCSSAISPCAWPNWLQARGETAWPGALGGGAYGAVAGPLRGPGGPSFPLFSPDTRTEIFPCVCVILHVKLSWCRCLRACVCVAAGQLRPKPASTVCSAEQSVGKPATRRVCARARRREVPEPGCNTGTGSHAAGTA
jgi:hypothetical protein